MLGLNFPVSNTLQRKFIMPDPKGIIPKDMPFTIYTDGQYLNWTAEELAFLQSEPEMRWITEEFPGAIHIKPESGRIKLGWAFSKEVVEPQWEISKLPYFPQVVIKGASRFIPALSAYVDQMPGPVIEYGGYYTRTAENWPLIGDTEIDNIFVIGALAGFGTMTACAAGELCAKTILGHDLPWYAAFFSPNRYSNPLIQNELSNLSLDGQL
jgi:glycine/D-amino acid oxidase-like deaminating enzyme